MSNLENGFTRISNEILTKLSQTKFNGSQMRIVLSIIRFSYGYHDKQCVKSKAELQRLSGMAKPQFFRELESLKRANIITDNNGILSFNKYSENWKGLQLVTRKEVSNPRPKRSPISDQKGLQSETSLVVKEKRKKEIYNIDNISAITCEVIDYLNTKAAKSFKYTTTNKTVISARLKEGFTLDNLKHVIDVKTQQWLSDEKMNAYLCPTTLFRPNNFERYLNEKKVTNGKYIAPL